MPEAPDVAMFAPSVFLSITIEDNGREDDDVHLHAGGQGIWIARMLRHLGHRPVVCAPVGGGSGRALAVLTHDWGIDLHPIPTEAATPTYVHDRRSGERHELARSRPPELSRQERDELYHATLELSGSDPASDTALCLQGFVTLTPLSPVEPADVPDVDPHEVVALPRRSDR